MEIWSNKECVAKWKFRKRNNCILKHNKDKDLIEVQLAYSPVLVDDIKVRFCSKAVSNKFIDRLSNFVLPQSDYSWPTLQY